MTSNICTRLWVLFMCLFACFGVFANEPKKGKDINTIIALVKERCGACHNVPSPALLPKKNWPSVVKIMSEMATEKMGSEYLSKDELNDITAYYYGSSPAELIKLPYNDDNNHGLNFTMVDVGVKSKIPFIDNIKPIGLAKNKHFEFLVSDAEKKQVTLLKKSVSGWSETKLADIEIPIYTDVVDYDHDGDEDIVVTDLGEFPPSKEMVGRVFLLRKNKSGGYDKELLIEGIPRATEARALDVDGDGDLDLAVSAFGGKNIGEIFWLENQGKNISVKHILLNLSGALNITPVDLNADGRMDLVSLISQEHEMIVAFIATDNKEFKTHIIARAPHPMFGSTGMRMADMDRDGDLDILFSNGDAFDTQMDPKPYHGVQWLENSGNLVFKFRDVGRSYGVASAVAGDIDGDGDMDVVASSFINYWEDKNRKSLVWFENDGHQNFQQHNFVSPPPGIVSFEVGDFTGDGKLDILAGVCRFDILKILMSNDAKAIAEAKKNTELGTRFIFLENKSLIKTTH